MRDASLGKHLIIGAVSAGLAGTAAAAAPPAGPAATTAARESQDLPTIIVTAQRRSESLQKTALTIQVVSPQVLATAGVTGPMQLSSLLPGIQVGSSGPAPSVYVRGVGAYSSVANTSPAVPFYADGVYISRSQSVPSEFYDLERLEVLKGPQGTLYGRNASGGAVNVITRLPQLGLTQAHGEGELGNYHDRLGEAALNLPLGATAALRLSGQVADKGGYTSEGYGDDKHQSVRAKLLWKPTDDVSLLLNGSYGHVGGRGPAVVLLNRDVPGWYPWLDGNSPQAQAIAAAAPANGPFNPAIGQFGPGSVVGSSPEQGRQNLNFYNLSAQLDWKFGDTTLTILPAYRRSDMQYTSLFGFRFENGYGLGSFPVQPETSRQSSLEARLAGTAGPVKYVAGLYYYDERQFQLEYVFGGLLENIGSRARIGTRSYAAFGQATVAVTPSVRLIVGLRGTSDRRRVSEGAVYNIFPSVIAPTSECFVPIVILHQPQCANDQFAGQKTFRKVSWKGGVEADLPGGGLAYATVSRGFKAGSFNLISVPSDPGSSTRVGTVGFYRPETLTSYDLGVKSRLLDGRLQLNAGLFYWDYTDHQEPALTLSPGGAINLIYFNAGKAYVYGANLDVRARVWPGGTLTLTGEYAKSKYQDFRYSLPTAFFNPASSACRATPQSGGLTELDCSGFEIARTPKWTGSAGFSQEWPVGAGHVVADANVNYASSRWLSVEFVPIERARGYAIANASLNYRAPDDRWSLTGFVRNINNGRSYTFAVASPLAPTYVSNIGAPRTYGARFAVTF